MSEEEFLQRTFFLSVVPSSYLLGIIKNKKISTEKLKTKYLEIFGKEVEHPKTALENLAYYKLILFFVKSNVLTIEEEKE